VFSELFEDYKMQKKIFDSSDPRKIKSYGRKVRGFNEILWREFCLYYVKEGNIAKVNTSI